VDDLISLLLALLHNQEVVVQTLLFELFLDLEIIFGVKEEAVYRFLLYGLYCLHSRFNIAFLGLISFVILLISLASSSFLLPNNNSRSWNCNSVIGLLTLFMFRLLWWYILDVLAYQVLIHLLRKTVLDEIINSFHVLYDDLKIISSHSEVIIVWRTVLAIQVAWTFSELFVCFP
jgi:hypothetical protein